MPKTKTKKLSKKSRKSIERLNANYKQIFIVVMSAPLFIALENLVLSTNPDTGIWEFGGWGNISLSSCVLFVIFFLTYIRFFLGDLRLLDLKYLEDQDSRGFEERYSSYSQAVDFFSLIIHAIFFYMLASAVTNFVYFYEIFFIFLFSNSGWLFTTYLLEGKTAKARKENRAALRWSLNNLLCSLALMFFILTYGLGNIYAIHFFTFVLSFNIIIDFILTWEVYFPKER